jgi:cytochrome c oxidase subunit II
MNMNRNRLLQLLGATAVVALILGMRARTGAAATEQVIHLTAKKFEYSPSAITVKKGQPGAIEIVSLDRKHGFLIPDFEIRTDVKPGGQNVVRFTPNKAGTFNFHCDSFCGSGHEGMAGTLVVVEQ